MRPVRDFNCPSCTKPVFSPRVEVGISAILPSVQLAELHVKSITLQCRHCGAYLSRHHAAFIDIDQELGKGQRQSPLQEPAAAVNGQSTSALW